MIYYYYGSKAGLYDAVVESLLSMQPFIGRLEDMVGGEGSAAVRLRSFIDLYLGSYPADAVRVGWYLRGSAELDRSAVRRFLGDQGRIQELAAALIGEGIERGELEARDVGYAASCLLGMLNTYVMRQAHFHEGFDPAEVSAFVHGFFLRAMGGTSDGDVPQERIELMVEEGA